MLFSLLMCWVHMMFMMVQEILDPLPKWAQFPTEPSAVVSAMAAVTKILVLG